MGPESLLSTDPCVPLSLLFSPHASSVSTRLSETCTLLKPLPEIQSWVCLDCFENCFSLLHPDQYSLTLIFFVIVLFVFFFVVRLGIWIQSLSVPRDVGLGFPEEAD